jgi:hypothetical protein
MYTEVVLYVAVHSSNIFVFFLFFVKYFFLYIFSGKGLIPCPKISAHSEPSPLHLRELR